MTEFKPGTEVLIPGTVKGGVGHGEVVVETTSGARFVARSADLTVPRNDRPTDERTERLARAMCGADGVDPDEKAALGAPPAAAGGFLVGSAHFPAWRLYAKYARALIDGGLA